MRSSFLRPLSSRVSHQPQPRSQSPVTLARSDGPNLLYKTHETRQTKSLGPERIEPLESNSSIAPTTRPREHTQTTPTRASTWNRENIVAQVPTSRCVADSSFASTSKLQLPSTSLPPQPNSTQTRTVLPPREGTRTTPTSILYASISSGLPRAAPKFYQLLRRIHSTFPTLGAEWFYQFHCDYYYYYSRYDYHDSSSHSSTSSHISTSPAATNSSLKSWTFLLDLAFQETNLRLARRILGDLKQLEQGERTGYLGEMPEASGTRAEQRNLARILLKGYRKLGQVKESRELLTSLAEESRAGDEREWVVDGRNTERLSLGSEGKGKAKADETEGGDARPVGGAGIGWKGWKVRPRELERSRAEHGESVAVSDLEPTRTQTLKKMKKKPPAWLLPDTSATSRRLKARVLIPPRAETLSSSSLTELVHLLVQDQRTAEAFALAETWLVHNKPRDNNQMPFIPSSAFALSSSSTQAPPSDLIVKAYRYNSSLCVLLNILLKPLILSRSRISTLLSFVAAFISRHSPASPLPQPSPPLSTLRELLSGLLGRRDAWRTGKRVVDHFGYRWGLPLAGDVRGFERAQDVLRLKFEAPDNKEWSRYLCLGDSQESIPTRREEEEKREQEGLNQVVRPHRLVPPSVAIILFRHAVDAQDDPRTELKAEDLQRFRKWWSLVTLQEKGSDWYRGSRMRNLLIRAGENGLLEQPYQSLNDQRRKGWWLSRQRQISMSRKKSASTKRRKGGSGDK